MQRAVTEVVPDQAAMATDARLLERLRADEPAAFEELIRDHGGRMLAVAKGILRSEEDAHDALQDAFLSAFRKLADFKGDARLSTWLHRIVVNAALMKLRGRRRRPEEPIDDLLPRFYPDGHRVDPGPPWPEDPENALATKQTAGLVRDCIDQLPESYRTVLILRDIEELDTAEAARLLQVSPGAVKLRLHRARQALRTLLDPHVRTAG